MALEIGTKLGPYEILSPIGAGGMGEVYRAKDTNLLRDVAIKVLPDKVAADAERLQRFKREATTVAALNHPNIVTIHGIEESSGHHYIAMELVEGESLDRLIPTAGMPLARIFDIAIPLADALAVAHDKGIVHTRPQAGQRHGDQGWSRQGAGLWARQADDGGCGRRVSPRSYDFRSADGTRRGHRHDSLHVAGAVAWRTVGPSHGPVFAGHHALRDGDRPTTF